jgi:hypothetical protein
LRTWVLRDWKVDKHTDASLMIAALLDAYLERAKTKARLGQSRAGKRLAPQANPFA